jgi:outer membrane biosynthesis protein TonB
LDSYAGVSGPVHDAAPELANMRQVPDEEKRIDVRLFAPAASGTRPAGRAIVGSSFLHVLAILLALAGLLAESGQAPPIERIVPVNLVLLGDKTTNAASSVVASLPQEKAHEVAPPKPAQAVPVPETPPPPTIQRRTAETSPPRVLESPRPQPKSEVPKSIMADRLDKRPEARVPPRKPSPADELSARLESLARLRQPAAQVPPDPRQQDGSGVSNATAAGIGAARGFDAAYALKDFIRAQVERRWNVDRSEIKSENWAVSIHILIDPNGRVTQAQIIDDPRFSANPAYEDFALSARNAVLLSSPLRIPPGLYDVAKDIVVDFDAKLLSR